MNLLKAIEDKMPKKKATTQVIDKTIDDKHYIQISYVAHWRAWCSYALLFPGQTCERLEERGGFSEHELNEFYPEWRNHIIKPKT